MSRMTAYEPGQFCWIDLMTPDAGSATKFYGELFGWSYHDAGDGYSEIRVGERANGGIRTVGPDEPDMPSF